MISASDLIVLPYDPQYSRAGVQYARDSLHYTYNRMKLNTADRLRKIVAGIAFEMAARRWLEAQGVGARAGGVGGGSGRGLRRVGRDGVYRSGSIRSRHRRAAV